MPIRLTALTALAALATLALALTIAPTAAASRGTASPGSASRVISSSSSSSSSSSRLNAASTHAYIRADYALLRSSDALVTPAQNDVLALNQRLDQECPRVGAGSPEDTASEPMSHEVIVALWSITFGTAAAPIHTFASTVSRLRWSNPRLTQLAHTYATNLDELATLPLPELCSDIRAWSATGFHAVPANVIDLVQHAESIEPRAVPGSLLSPYETTADHTIYTRAHRLEIKLQNIETSTGFNDWDTVLATLGLNQ